MTKKITWNPIADMDLEDGTHTCYYTAGKDGWYVMLTQTINDTWDVELGGHKVGDIFYTLVTCKTLTSAKRWAARNLNIA